MTRFDRYLLAQLLVIFGVASVVLVGLYWINQAVRLFDWLIGSGQNATVFLEFTALSLPNIIRLVLPVSAFAAAVYVTNRMASESELVVVQATGFGPFRLARPVLLFGLFVGLFVSVLVHFVVPASLTRLADREFEVNQNVTSQFLTAGQFIHPTEGVTFYIRDINADRELLDIFLRDAREGTREVIYTASRAKLVRSDDGPRLVMFDGMAQGYGRDSQSLSVTRFVDLTFDISSVLESMADPAEEKRDHRELWTADLLAPTEAVRATTRASLGKMVIEGHRRFTQGLMAVVAPLIGFATLLLGGFSRFGVWNQIFIAIGLIVVLQTLDNAAADAATSDLSIWPIVYAPAAFGFILATSILWLAAHPALLRRRERSSA
ncbi:MAG: LPS export ABC transporter permease LptF [Pseudomonadota bacterium]